MQEELAGRHDEAQDVTPLKEQPMADDGGEDMPESGDAAPDGNADTSRCAGCGGVLEGGHFLLNNFPWCSACKEELEHQTRFTFRKLLKSSLAGYVGAIAAGGLWALVTIVTGYQVGLIAIFVGLIAGHAVRWGARPVTGKRFQILALVLTFLGLSYSTIPMLIKEFKENPDYLEDLKKGWTEGIEKTEADMEAGADVSQPGSSVAEAENGADTREAAPVSDEATAPELVQGGTVAPAEESGEGAETVAAPAKPEKKDADRDMNPFLGLLVGLGLLAAGVFIVLFVAPPVIYVLYLFSDPISFLFLAIALWEAWRINTPVKLEFEGPVQRNDDMDFSKAQYENP